MFTWLLQNQWMTCQNHLSVDPSVLVLAYYSNCSWAPLRLVRLMFRDRRRVRFRSSFSWLFLLTDGTVYFFKGREHARVLCNLGPAEQISRPDCCIRNVGFPEMHFCTLYQSSLVISPFAIIKPLTSHFSTSNIRLPWNRATSHRY